MTRSNGQRHPILIVDDEPDVLTALRSLFRRDYEVLTASGANEALDLLSEHDVHVVICDQRMPGMKGTELLAIVAERYPLIVRLMITGYADVESVVAAINRGHVYRYISKPWQPGELKSVLEQAIEQYEMRAERGRLLRELEEANRLKTAFISIASHELNTPLTVVLGMLQLARKCCQDPKVAGYLDRSLSSAQRLQSLVADKFKVLQAGDFGRPLERAELDVGGLLREVLQELDPYLTLRKQTVEVSLDPPDVHLRASRQHLVDVLENLLTNAIKFSPDGATIHVRVRAESEPRHRVVIEVADAGVGIPPEDQPHVFEPLFSTLDTMHHSTGEFGFRKRGLGLGLAIVKKFVEMHGGTVDFRTEPEQGTVFRVILPQGNAAAANGALGSPVEEFAPNGSIA